MRWGCAHTHTHILGESGHWVCGSNGRLQWKDLCVAVVAILGPFSSGAFVSHPRRASSQRHKESGKRRESEGSFFFFTLSPQHFFLFWLQRILAGTWMPIMIHIQAILKKGWGFWTCTLSCVGCDAEIKRRCRLRCNSHDLLFKYDLTGLQVTEGLLCDTV